MASDIPDKIGAYEIDEELGRGAMGAVFRAHHEYTQREVALKVIFEHVAAHDIGVERFRREVSVSSRVEDPGVVEIFDAGPYENTFYYAMEMLEGQELGDVAPSLPLSERIRLIVDVCRSLGECHKAGIVHRDLKPENIFVVDEEHSLTKIFDFGISSMRDAPRATATGNVVGTPVFMSPEQAKDATNVTPAADVWSIGVILYELTTDRLPVDADSSTQVLIKVANADLDYLEYSEAYPDALVDIINRCLEPDPEDRFKHAAELYEALDDVLQNSEWPESGRRSSIPDAYNPEPLTMTHDSGMGSGLAPSEGLGQTLSSSADNSQDGPAPVQVNEDLDDPVEPEPPPSAESSSIRRSVVWGLVICGLGAVGLAGLFLFAWSDGEPGESPASPAVTQANSAAAQAIDTARQRLDAVAEARRAGSQAATRLHISVLRGPQMPDGAKEQQKIKQLARSMTDDSMPPSDTAESVSAETEQANAETQSPPGRQATATAESSDQSNENSDQSFSNQSGDESDGARAATETSDDQATGAPEGAGAETGSSPTTPPSDKTRSGESESPDAGSRSNTKTAESPDPTGDSDSKESASKSKEKPSSKKETTTKQASDASKSAGQKDTEQSPSAADDKQTGSDDKADDNQDKKDADDDKKEPEFFSF